MKVGVIGLGKLGAPMAALHAARGHTVIGVDRNPRAVADIQAGRAPWQEPGLEGLIQEAGTRLTVTTDITKVENCQIIFLIVPTPSKIDDTFSTDYLVEAINELGRALRATTPRPIVVVTSTVNPGDMDAVIVPALQRAAGDIPVPACYSPEFIAIGSVVRDMQIPDYVLIGQADQRAGDVLAEFYRTVCQNDPPITQMSYINAELTKLATNCYVTTKISYANMLGELCDRLPGADAYVVTQAIGLDSRIGRSYLRPAAAYGGTCFPRDNRALRAVAKSVNMRLAIPEATDEINQNQVGRLLDLIGRHMSDSSTLAILGLSYKANTPVIEESPGLALAAMACQAWPIVVYDPLGMPNAKLVLPYVSNDLFAETAQEAVDRADVVVIMTPWPEFRSLVVPDDVMVIDCWRMFSSPSHHYVIPGSIE